MRRCKQCQFAPCRCEDLQVGFTPAQATKGRWPIYSDAAGVHPDQIPEAMDEAKRLGVPIQFKRDGRAIFDNEQHKRRYAKAIGLFDRNSFL